MTKCKYCSAEIDWKRNRYTGRWVAYVGGNKHLCRERLTEPFVHKIRVFCKTCKEWIPEKETEFLNIEEDIQGKDVLTFKCPKCGQESKSHRVG